MRVTCNLLSSKSTKKWSPIYMSLSIGSCLSRADESNTERSSNDMEQYPVGFSPAAYASILKQCIAANAQLDGKRAHEQITKAGLEGDTYLGNLLVQMYGKCGNVEDARKVFERIRVRNVFSWNILIAAYAQNGHLQDASTLFTQMPERNVVTWNAIISAYSQNGQLEDAKHMFEVMPERNVVSWNSLIAAHPQDARKVLELFCKMNQEGIHPTCITFINVLEAFATSPSPADVEFINWIIVENGFLPNVAVEGGILNVFGKLGYMEQAKSMFDRMSQKNVVSWTLIIAAFTMNGHLEDARMVFQRMPQSNLITWNTMLLGNAQAGKLEDARDMFEQMPQRSVVSWTTMVTAYAQIGHLENAKRSFERMPQLDVVSLNSMITAYAQNGHPKAAIRLFQLMDLEGMPPDHVTYASVLDACSSHTEEAKAIYATLVDTGFNMDVAVETALLDVHGKSGNLEAARSIFERMATRSILTWNSMMAAYARIGHHKEALQHLRRMGLEGELPDGVTFISMISACSHAGLVEDSHSHFLAMLGDYGIPPTHDHYMSMVDLLSRAGQLQDGEDLVNNMPFQPDAVAWIALLGACAVHGGVERGAAAAKNALDLGGERAAPYVLLSSIWKRSTKD